MDVSMMYQKYRIVRILFGLYMTNMFHCPDSKERLLDSLINNFDLDLLFSEMSSPVDKLTYDRYANRMFIIYREAIDWI